MDGNYSFWRHHCKEFPPPIGQNLHTMILLDTNVFSEKDFYGYCATFATTAKLEAAHGVPSPCDDDSRP